MLTACSLVQAEPLALSKAYWKDESFLKSFNGSYRINARIEPSVSSDERALLVQVQKKMAAGHRAGALASLKNSSLFKKSAALQYNAASICLELDQVDQAVSYYSAAIKLFPSFRRAHKNLGVTYTRVGKMNEAKQSLVRAVELGDLSGSTMGLLGYCHLQDGHYASALQSYRLAQLSEPTVVDWKAGIAQCLLEMDQSEEALALVEEIVVSRPNESAYQLLLVSVLLDLEKELKAISVLELLHRSDSLGLSEIALLAQLHSRSGDSRLARPLFDKLIEALDASILPQYLNAVEIVMHNAEWGYAAELLEAVPAELDLPMGMKNRLNRLKALNLVQRGESGAESLLSAVIKSDPLDGEALLLLAKVKEQQKAHEEAFFYLERAEKVEAVRYRALLALGKLYVVERKYAKAVEVYELAEAMQSTPDQRKYIEALKRLQ